MPVGATWVGGWWVGEWWVLGAGRAFRRGERRASGGGPGVVAAGGGGAWASGDGSAGRTAGTWRWGRACGGRWRNGGHLEMGPPEERRAPGDGAGRLGGRWRWRVGVATPAVDTTAHSTTVSARDLRRHRHRWPNPHSAFRGCRVWTYNTLISGVLRPGRGRSRVARRGRGLGGAGWRGEGAAGVCRRVARRGRGEGAAGVARRGRGLGGAGWRGEGVAGWRREARGWGAPGGAAHGLA